MVVGLYTSASGMLAEATRHEVIANNLANVSTTGFKRDVAVLRQHPVQFLHRLSDNVMGLNGVLMDLAPAIGSRGEGAQVESILPNLQQGTLIDTDNPTDMALQGEGFFTVDTVRGRRYSRQGNFTLDAQGRLVTMGGDPVLTTTGAQIKAAGKKLEINASGIIFLDGTEAGRLAVVVPDSQDMVVKEGEGLFAPVPGARFRDAGATVQQGAQERSNVNAITEMASMLTALRSYEANQRAILAQDETLNTLISQVGRFG